MRLEPGMLVRAPGHPDWGLGQVQSVVGERVTVNFTEAGRVVMDVRWADLDWVGADPADKP